MNASGQLQALNDTPDLLALLAARQAQAQPLGAAYAPPMPADGTMTHWLAAAARQLREAAGRKQVHIAASMSKDQSSVYRFEEHKTVPREIDLFVAAYADDLDIRPTQIWDLALDLWRDNGKEATVSELNRDVRTAAAAAELAALPEQLSQAVAERKRRARERSAKKTAAARRKSA